MEAKILLISLAAFAGVIAVGAGVQAGGLGFGGEDEASAGTPADIASPADSAVDALVSDPAAGPAGQQLADGGSDDRDDDEDDDDDRHGRDDNEDDDDHGGDRDDDDHDRDD